MTITNAQLLLDIGAGKLSRVCCLVGDTGNTDDALALIDYLAQLSTEQKKLLLLRACACAKCPAPGQVQPAQQPGQLPIPNVPAGVACADTIVKNLCSDAGQGILTKIEAIAAAAALLPPVAAEPVLMGIVKAAQVAIVALRAACRDPKLATQAAASICVLIQMMDPQMDKVQAIIKQLSPLMGAIPVPAWLGNAAITALRSCCKGAK